MQLTDKQRKTPQYVYHEDILSDTVRRERRSLYVFSFLSLAIAVTSKLPESIPSVGIPLGPTSQRVFLLGVLLATVYHVVLFGIHAWYQAEGFVRRMGDIEFGDEEGKSKCRRYARLRQALECYLPIAVGTLACIYLCAWWLANGVQQG